jgi:nitroimidazol reductase NimA-like FMN-containing flavoprotein (pyridoxamine 5'-phosphate oxidase superfamily)
MTEEPEAEVMSREGKGTRASTPQGNETPTPWQEAQRRFAAGGWFWLATVRADGAPHVVPVFAAWADGAFFVASKDTAAKSRHLDAEPRCTLTRDAGDLHLVVEGTARKIRDDATLARAVQAFAAVYDWPTKISAGQLDADYGAPTSGGPPYDVYEVVPVKAFGFPTDGESFTPTRWRFPR